MKPTLTFILLMSLVAFPKGTPRFHGSKNLHPPAAEEFAKFDFKNRSYPYKDSVGKRGKVALENGKYEYDLKEERGWFDFENVYFADLTNDAREEAIVMLSHVSCGASCDGGSELFYVYSVDRQHLKLLWQYETGSLAYGCGLKSFSVAKARITLELFGRCINQNKESPGTGKFRVKDVTRITFSSNGRRIVPRVRKLIPTAEISVLNYQPLISVDR